MVIAHGQTCPRHRCVNESFKRCDAGTLLLSSCRFHRLRPACLTCWSRCFPYTWLHNAHNDDGQSHNSSLFQAQRIARGKFAKTIFRQIACVRMMRRMSELQWVHAALQHTSVRCHHRKKYKASEAMQRHMISLLRLLLPLIFWSLIHYQNVANANKKNAWKHQRVTNFWWAEGMGILGLEYVFSTHGLQCVFFWMCSLTFRPPWQTSLHMQLLLSHGIRMIEWRNYIHCWRCGILMQELSRIPAQ